MSAWRPPKRLRHLESLATRGVLELGEQGSSEEGAPAAEADTGAGALGCVATVLARVRGEPVRASQACGRGGSTWQLIYRSEAVCGTINPEWRPVPWDAWQRDEALDGSHGQLVMGLHVVRWEEVQRRPSLQRPMVFGPADRPHLILPAATTAPAAGDGADGAGRGARHELDAQLHRPDELRRQQQQQQQPLDEQAEEGELSPKLANGMEEEVEGQEQGHDRKRAAGKVENGPKQQPEQQKVHAAAAGALQAERPPEAPLPQAPSELEEGGSPRATPTAEVAGRGGSSSEGACADGASSAGLLLSALAGLPADAVPGRPVAAWQLDLEQLHVVGPSLAALRQPLRPHSVLLEFGDGWYVHPPPQQVAPSPSAASLQASPAKAARRAREREEGEAGAAAGGATRRFASLVMSKLLRGAGGSEPGTDPGSEAPSEDESDAGSVGSAASGATAATTAAAGGGAAAAPPAPARQLTSHGVQQCVLSIAALQSRLTHLHVLAAQQARVLEGRLAAHRQAREQAAQLAGARARLGALRARAAAAAAALEEARAGADAVRRGATVRAQALVTTLRVLQGTERRLADAEASLAGEEGRGRLVAALRELVARRCLMVAQLGAIFKVGPMTVTLAEAPPGGYLEDRLDQQWAGSGSGAAGLLRVPPGAGAGALESPGKLRREVRLSIGGLEVRPAVWRKAFDEDGYERDWEEDRAAGAALGDAAQLVDRLSAYLDVPLRRAADDAPPGRGLFGGGGGGGGGGDAGARAAAYPLFCDSNRERPRFAVGVFLLNKDIIQLLQAHGISAAGPNQLLHNLHKLLLAAQSALPPGLVPR
eukprot:scaffold17.g545.t1